MKHWTLANGLQVYHLQDPDSSQVVLNLLYKVGARDESPTRTGFAHLFEHLMFAGSQHVPSFDQAIEGAGGQNNAFTNNEFTNYYILVPYENAETAFWLESDRMRGLNINPKSLQTQQGVVIEEFKQRCFNAPFGQLWHHLRRMLYSPKSPYSWPTIGLNFEHIETATLEDVQAFYNRFYRPSNGILTLCGALNEEEAHRWSEKWFGDIENPSETLVEPRQYPLPLAPLGQPQEEEDLSTDPALFLVWPSPSHRSPDANALDLLAEVLSGSEASPFVQQLVKKERLFSAAEAFCVKGLDEGFFVLYGILSDGVSFEQAQEALLRVFSQTLQANQENALRAVQNRLLTQLLYERISPAQQAQKLAYYAAMGQAARFENEHKELDSVNWTDCQEAASTYIKPPEARVLRYTPKTA